MTADGDQEEDDYWSAEAVERRRKLKERLFADSDDDEDDDEDQEEREQGSEEEADEDDGDDSRTESNRPPKGFMLRSREIVHTEPDNNEVDESSPAAIPASKPSQALKVPPRRKSTKGVSFASHAAVRHFDKEEALGPEPAAPKAQSPIGTVEEEVAKAIAGVGTSSQSKAATTTDFSGLKRGFLNTPKAASPARKETLEPIQPPHEPVAVSSPPKRQSLFAQHRAAGKQNATTGRVDSGDVAGAAAGTIVKSAVVERAPPPPKPEEHVVKASKTQSSEVSDEDSNSIDVDADAPDDYYSDDSTSFDITDAMLAREAAIAYHAKRADLGRRGLGGWTGSVRHKESVGPVDRDSDDEMFDDGDVWEEWWHDQDGMAVEPGTSRSAVGFGERVVPHAFQGQDGSVSLPQVVPGEQGLGAIKVGKLENGNLVVREEDDSEDDLRSSDVERRQAAENKARMLERLKSTEPIELIKEEEEQRRRQQAVEVEPPRARHEPPAIEPPPKQRISKFKAARLAQRDSE